MFTGEIKPEEDGITHINCYSKSKTILGRQLSNFELCRFTCEDGQFSSIEGYWYWLGTDHVEKDRLRAVYGWQAKALGKDLKGPDYPKVIDFQKKIKAAIECKLAAHPSLKANLLASDLPLTHYYMFGTFAKRDERSDWVWEYYERYREANAN